LALAPPILQKQPDTLSSKNVRDGFFRSIGSFLQGSQVYTVSVPAGQYLTKSYTVTISNGQLDLGLQGQTGNGSFARINGLDIG
jgi:hypothetical protein